MHAHLKTYTIKKLDAVGKETLIWINKFCMIHCPILKI